MAIKILPEALFAHDPDRVARFQREAKTLASLNHPNIGGIYGLEEAQGITGLVLELVEGPTLAERIANRAGSTGPGLRVDEALAIAKQIAEALEAAHEHGIIHRDLKPANIKVREDGTVKVLDFGLAKALDPADAGYYRDGRGVRLQPDLTHSPTLSLAATQAGVILGTAAYMSPEQAKGRPADKRSDIWAFGCVLYEMLTGRRAFDAPDAAETMAYVMAREPDWPALPPNLPPPIHSLVKRCLAKDRRERLGDIAAVLFVLREPLIAPQPTAGDAEAVVAAAPVWRRALPWALAAALAVVASVLLIAAMRREAPSPAAPLRLEVSLGVEASLDELNDAAALSPDGTMLAFSGREPGSDGRQLYVRRLDALQATPLPGTAGAYNPFFAPDGQWVGFFAEGKLKKVAVTGGAVVTLCDAPFGRGGSWETGGMITFASAGIGVDLWRVSSSGGKPTPLTMAGAEELQQRYPQVLPGGAGILYTEHIPNRNYDDATLVVQAATGERKVIHRGGYHGRYVRSGHVVYIHGGTLFALPFDLARLEVTGQAVPVVAGVAESGGGTAQFTVSENGTLAYVPGEARRADAPISWLNSSGALLPLRAATSDWSHPNFDPKGERLALDIDEAGQQDVWIYEYGRDALSKLTFDPAQDVSPVWTPDGRRIVFASSRGAQSALNVYWQRADGAGDVQRLTESRNGQFPGSWHPSGKFLSIDEHRADTHYDVLILPMEGDENSGWKPGKPRVFVSTPFEDQDSMFSPDGRWIAYASNESGRQEVYVRPFPDPGGKWQVSTEGGRWPTWSRTRQELYFSTLDNRVAVASYAAAGDSFRVDKPRLWSDVTFMARGGGREFALHPDGTRVALAVRADADAPAPPDRLVFVFNFTDELRRVAPAANR